MKILIAVRKPSHTAHNSKNIITSSIDSQFSSILDSGVELQEESSVVYARHIDGSTWLVFFGFKTERVDVDARGIGDISVVLVRLDKVKVFAIASLEAIVTVELNLGRVNGINGIFTSEGVLLNDGDVEELVVDDTSGFSGVVGPFVISFSDFIELDGPDEFLDGVIEVEARLV